MYTYIIGIYEDTGSAALDFYIDLHTMPTSCRRGIALTPLKHRFQSPQAVRVDHPLQSCLTQGMCFIHWDELRLFCHLRNLVFRHFRGLRMFGLFKTQGCSCQLPVPSPHNELRGKGRRRLGSDHRRQKQWPLLSPFVFMAGYE